MKAFPLRMWKWLDARAKSASMRMVKWTGKSEEFIHPKHLVDDPSHHWYAGYVRPGDVVLDVGCGNGAHTGSVASHHAQAVGFDVDTQQLRIGAREAKRRRQANVYLLVCSAQQSFPFLDSCCDRVLFLDVIEHLDDRDLALLEIRRVLKEDGLLLLSAPNRDTSWKRAQRGAGLFYYTDPDHRIEYTEEELKKELSRGHFEATSLMPIVLDTPCAGFIDLIGGISLPLYQRLMRWKRGRAAVEPSESIGFRAVCRKVES